MATEPQNARSQAAAPSSSTPVVPPTLPEEELSILPHDDALRAEANRSASRRASGGASGGGCRGCLYVIGGGVGCFGILVIALVVLIIALPATVGSAITQIAGSLGVNVPPPAANVISTQTIITGIQPLGQLVTISSQLARADVQVSITQGALNACGFSANHVVQGTVSAGIDLTRLDEASIRFDAARDTYVLTVPEPELTSCSVDFIRQYERSFTACSGVDWDEARLLANYLSLIDFRETAIEGGILQRAQSETQLVLGNFVRLLTGHSVEVVFAAPPTPSADATAEPVSYPASCAPDVPSGWVQNANGEWVKVQ
ncbi:MAG: DUF4230 domain-containing protein [Anaerolineae bacterium]